MSVMTGHGNLATGHDHNRNWLLTSRTVADSPVIIGIASGNRPQKDKAR